MIDVNFSHKSKYPLFNLGFRPFFLCAGLFAVVSMMIWTLAYISHMHLPLITISPLQWHAHEMIYGYSVAVIAGFLLTAVKNWTNLQTLYGTPLLTLVTIWLTARILLFMDMILAAGIFDLSFLTLLCLAIISPIKEAKQWKQMAIVFKLLALLIANSLFYLGALDIVNNGIYLGIYAGLYLVISLIMMLGRRVIPFFIESGVDHYVKLHNSKSLDLSSLALFLIFFITELMQSYPMVSAYSALLIVAVNTIRLLGWYTQDIWKKPLLWSLYIAMWFITLGFFLHFLAYAVGISKFIAIHAFAYGGIGMMTLGMMSRVSLGHTGRNIDATPAGIQVAFICLCFGVLFRVLLCVIAPSYYTLWIGIAQVLWIVAFLIFSYLYYPILTNQRLDGKFG
jgi:uncharacterized protein involved in response to NO